MRRVVVCMMAMLLCFAAGCGDDSNGGGSTSDSGLSGDAGADGGDDAGNNGGDDSGTRDSGSEDSGPEDSGPEDSGSEDSGSEDAGLLDADPADADPADADFDADPADADTTDADATDADATDADATDADATDAGQTLVSADTCGSAYDVTGGGTFTFDASTLADDYQVTADDCDGLAWDTDGGDAVFEVQLNAGDYISVDVTPDNSSDDPQLYLVEDCTDTASHASTCQAGIDAAGAGDSETLTHQVSAQGTYYIVADSYAPTTSGTWQLDVEHGASVCTVGERQCATGGNDVEICSDPRGPVSQLACDEGCSTTTGGDSGCQGDLCGIAIDATAGGTFQIDTATMVGDYSVSDTDCPGMNYASGMMDVVFEVSLQSGESLDVTATPGTGLDDAQIYVVTDCTDSTTHANTCQSGIDDGGGGVAETLQFSPAAAGTYYVVVSSFLDDYGDSWTIDFTIQ